MGEHIWYPLSRPDDERICIQRAEGIYLYDKRGKQYIDANSGLWNVPLGYGNQAVRKSIELQMSQISYVNACEFGTTVGVGLADKLREIHHEDIDKILYTCSGSESVEVAIKLIRKYASLGSRPEKNGILVMKNSYHGNYYGSMSCSDYDGKERTGYGPLINRIWEIDIPFANYGDRRSEEEKRIAFEQHLEEQLLEHKDEIAGIILEPVLGSAGVFPLPEWYIRKIARFTEENDALLVFDEVATGFGRTGKMFFYEHIDGVRPDIITMSKGINNGVLPMGAVAVSRRITDRFRDKDEFLFHLSTQNGNALCCAAAEATLNELNKDGQSYIQDVQNKNKYFLELFQKEIGEEIAGIRGLRECGMMFAIELQEAEEVQLPFNKLLKLVELLKKNGVVLEWSYIENMTSSLVLFLPLIISNEEINELIARLKKSIKRIMR